MKLKARRPSKGMGDLELLSLQSPKLKGYPWGWTAPQGTLRKEPRGRNGQGTANPTQQLLCWINSTSGRQLLRRSMGLPWGRDMSQSGYYSEDSDFNSVSMTSAATSGVSTPMQR